MGVPETLISPARGEQEDCIFFSRMGEESLFSGQMGVLLLESLVCTWYKPTVTSWHCGQILAKLERWLVAILNIASEMLTILRWQCLLEPYLLLVTAECGRAHKRSWKYRGCSDLESVKREVESFLEGRKMASFDICFHLWKNVRFSC